MDTGCKYRHWGWHDGGPNYTCSKQGKNYNCKDSYSDYFDENCEIKDDEECCN